MKYFPTRQSCTLCGCGLGEKIERGRRWIIHLAPPRLSEKESYKKYNAISYISFNTLTTMAAHGKEVDSCHSYIYKTTFTYLLIPNRFPSICFPFSKRGKTVPDARAAVGAQHTWISCGRSISHNRISDRVTMRNGAKAELIGSRPEYK